VAKGVERRNRENGVAVGGDIEIRVGNRDGLGFLGAVNRMGIVGAL
jgi:hypothetical protein